MWAARQNSFQNSTKSLLASLRVQARLRLSPEQAKEIAGVGPVAALKYLSDKGFLEKDAAQEEAVKELQRFQEGLTEFRKKVQVHSEESKRLTEELKEAVSKMPKPTAEKKERAWWSRRSAPVVEYTVGGDVCHVSLGPSPRASPAGTFLQGGVGGGKTTLMDIFYLSVAPEATKGRLRMHFHEFMLDVQLQINKLAKKLPKHENITEYVADQLAEETDLICLDELALTNVAETAIFKILLERFLDRGVSVVTTSNRPPEDLYLEGLNREVFVPGILKLIGEMTYVQLRSPDYRDRMYKEVKKDSLFFSPLTPTTDALLKQGFKGEPSVAHVSWGRTVPVEASAGGVALFHFDDLCRAPLSADDFSILGKQFHTFLIHSIPILTLEEHNEARRFTNLIDILYEQSARLVCTAEAGIEEVLQEVQVLSSAQDMGNDPRWRELGLFEKMYDDSPNYQLKNLEQERYNPKEPKVSWASSLFNPENVGVPVGGEIASHAQDFSAAETGVAGVMVAAVGSLQESGFAARRAISRVNEMQTDVYLKAHKLRLQNFEMNMS